MSRVLGNLGRNLRSLLWALLLSLSVWVAAVTAADPDEVRALPVPITLQVLGQDPRLVITGEIPATVRLTIRAPRSVWTELNGSPDSVRAVLDLSAIDAGDHRLSPQIQIDARPARVVSVSPSSISLVLEPLITKSLALQTTISGEPAVGYQAGDLELEPREVLVSGPESQVGLVTRVRVVINMNGIRESINQAVPDAQFMVAIGLAARGMADL